MTEKQKEICEMILNHLRRNPEATDTLEGIVRWWLEITRIETSVEDVARALEHLVRNQVLSTRSLPDGVVLYRACERAWSTPAIRPWNDPETPQGVQEQ